MCLPPELAQLTSSALCSRGFYALHTGDQWLTLTLDFIGALLSFLVSMLVVALKGQLGPATSALILERVRLPLVIGRGCRTLLPCDCDLEAKGLLLSCIYQDAKEHLYLGGVSRADDASRRWVR